MCTAITYKPVRDSYFGRNLDYEFSYGENIVIIPRDYPFKFRHIKQATTHHYGIIGVAHMADNYPLLYDAINEKGLGVAGLNFVNNAHYFKPKRSALNIAQFEFIPYILSTCQTVKEAKKLLKKINITDTQFNSFFPPSSLHYLIADKNSSITVESVSDGLKVYDNPIGVLTNNPPFDKQMFNLNNYRHLSCKERNNTFLKDVDLSVYSRGMGGIGLPGDLSSMSRFVRAAFVKANSISNGDEISRVNQFFHILHSVEQQRGCCEVGDGKYEITIYTDCYDLNHGICYYTTYKNHQINAVDMNKVDLNSDKLSVYDIIDDENINYQN